MSTSPVLVEKPQTITTIGGRHLATRGFTHDALETHLRDHSTKGQWCDIYCATRVFYGRATEENRRQMRRRLGKASAEFLERGLLLLKKYGGRFGAIEGVKLYDRTHLPDQEHAIAQRIAMEERGEATMDTLNLIDRVIGVSAQNTADVGSLPSAVLNSR